LAGCAESAPPRPENPLQSVSVSESTVQLPFSVRVAVQGFELQGDWRAYIPGSAVGDKDAFKKIFVEYLMRRKTFREVVDGPADVTLGVKATLTLAQESFTRAHSEVGLQGILIGPEGVPLGRYDGRSSASVALLTVVPEFFQAVDDLLAKIEDDYQGILAKAQSKQEPARPSSATASVSGAVPPSDVDRLPSMKAKPKANAYAIVVGIETYRNKLPKADYAARDAEVMSDYLTKVMGYQEENVALLLNDRAAKADIEKYFEKWLPNRVEKDASVFVYFSGHGAPNPKTGDAYLVPYDGDPAFVDETGYALKRLYQQVGKLPARDVVVMLDSCFSGAGGRSVIGKGMRPMVLSVENPVLASGKTVVLAASAGDQVSSTHDKKSHGLLTYFVLKGLQGEADGNGDGAVELQELFAYLKPQVERTARREYNNEQTPQLLGSPDLLTKGVRLVERTDPPKP
jgi:hypothetical protein